MRFDGISRKLANVWLRILPIRNQGTLVSRGSRINSDTTIGVGSRINGKMIIKGSGQATIGAYCAIGDGLLLVTSNHDVSCLAVQYKLQQLIVGHRMASVKRDIVIGNDVWIGDRVTILPGVTVGDGAVLGSGAVVTKSVENYTVVAGNPAKPIKLRAAAELVHLLLDLQWWGWEIEKMKVNKKLFEIPIDSPEFLLEAGAVLGQSPKSRQE